MNRLMPKKLPELIGGALVAAAIQGCAGPPPDAFEEPDLPSAQVAVLNWGGGVWGGSRDPVVASIDGKPVQASLWNSSARVAPGIREIVFIYSVYRGLYAIPAHAHVRHQLTFDAEAGHVYRLKTECDGLGSYNCMSWLEDETAEIIVAGSIPDHIDGELKARSAKAKSERIEKDRFDELSAAAACGDAIAQYDLALYYLAGIEPVVGRDLQTAYVWFRLAEFNGHTDAAATGQRIAGDLSQTRLSEANRLIGQARGRACEE
jgi:hypothetical protein